MLKIRLQRIGRKNDPSYRVVVVDSRQGPQAGKYIDLIGTHNPKLNATVIDGEKARKWIKNGAQVSPTLHNLMITKGIIEGKKINVLPRKTPIVAAVAATEAAAVPTESVPGEMPVVEPTEVPETPAEVPAQVPTTDAPAETATAETPAQ